MSKESTAGTVCRCGVTIYYHDYHWEHCPEKDKWETKKKTKEEKGGRSGKSKSRRQNRAGTSDGSQAS